MKMLGKLAGRARRWWWLGLLCAVVLLVAAVEALPWWLSSSSGRVWLTRQADRILAPGRLDLGSIEFSWWGPTRMKGFALRDHAGDVVLSAPRAVWDRNLWQVLFQRPRLGTVWFEAGALDVERDAEGEFDLFETLRPVLKGDPRLDLKVRVTAGRLRFRSPGLLGPVEADRADVALDLPPRPAPIAWRLALGRTEADQSLDFTGSFNVWQLRDGRAADLVVDLRGASWPLAVGDAGVGGSGRLDGSLRAERQAGRWLTRGDLAVIDLDLHGERLRGDHLRTPRVSGVWDASEGEEGWTVGKLEVSAPFGRLAGSGSVGSAAVAGLKAEGRLDLAAIAAQLPRTLRLREGISLEQGTAELAVRSVDEAGKTAVEVSAGVSDLRVKEGERRFTLTDPARLSARLTGSAGRSVRFERFDVEAPYLKLTARSDTDEKGTTFTGTFDLARLRSQLRELVDLGSLEMAGQGTFSGDYLARPDDYRGRLQAEVRGLRLEGAGPYPVALDRPSISLEVTGPRAAQGWPAGWGEARSVLSSGAISAEVRLVEATSGGTVRVHRPLVIGKGSAEAELRVEGRWRENGLDVDQFECALVPASDDERRGPLRSRARGRYDQATGELHLLPVGPATPPGVLELADEGLRVTGIGAKGGPRLDVGLEGSLGPLGPWLPDGYENLSGTWTGRATSRPDDAGVHLGGEVTFDGLALNGGATDQSGPLGLKVQAMVPTASDRIDLAELVVSSQYLVVESSGRLDEMGGKRRLGLSGRTIPDWDRLTAELAQRVEPGAHVRGRPRPFTLSVDLSEDWRETLEAEVGTEVDAADVFGLKVGPTPLVARVKQGKPTIDPITVSVNQGQVHLEPEVRLDDEQGPTLRLGPGSTVSDVQINPTVSHRFLSFVAPVLDNATRVRGSVSARIDEAIVPLTRPGGLQVTGEVAFQQVEFTPGPFLDPLLNMVGRPDFTLMKLDQPVELTIADRRVVQRGLSLPIGKLNRIDLEGWVDFDRNLDLVASIPIVPTALANAPVIGGFVEPTRIRIPVRGTLEHPRVDEEAFAAGMKQMGASILNGPVTRGANELLDLFRRPRGQGGILPPPAPRLTPQERRERRLEKKEERRSRRGDGA